jgi:hypothetical protein
MSYGAKFCPGMWLRNRNTQEEGFVIRSYRAGDDVMYKMSLPNKRGEDYISDWNEKLLGLADSQAKAATGSR